MDKLRFRDLQRWKYTDLEKVLPISITYDSQVKLVVLSVEMYNRLVSEYKREQSDRHDSQAKSPQLYNSQVHKSGDTVLVKQGKRLVEAVVPELDVDGRPIPLI